jgi:ferredoxin--NADP+ reductase
VDAIVADYEMDDAALPFLELNAAFYDDPARQNCPATPPAPAPCGLAETGSGPLRVAIVDSGPAGCYVAEELLGKRAIDVRIDMFERQVTPFGLVALRVAPDHQKTKAIGDRFARSLHRDKVRLFLNVEVGENTPISSNGTTPTSIRPAPCTARTSAFPVRTFPSVTR